MLLALDLAWFPPINAMLNATSAVLLVLGFIAIRRGYRRLHAALMIAAVIVSIVFLASYVTYHVQKGGVTRFTATGLPRTIYFTILISHTVLAVTVPFLAARTVYLAVRARFDAHRRLARITLPIWLYVSVTGVLVYFMLYRWYRPGA